MLAASTFMRVRNELLTPPELEQDDINMLAGSSAEDVPGESGPSSSEKRVDRTQGKIQKAKKQWTKMGSL